MKTEVILFREMTEEEHAVFLDYLEEDVSPSVILKELDLYEELTPEEIDEVYADYSKVQLMEASPSKFDFLGGKTYAQAKAGEDAKKNMQDKKVALSRIVKNPFNFFRSIPEAWRAIQAFRKGGIQKGRLAWELAKIASKHLLGLGISVGVYWPLKIAWAVIKTFAQGVAGGGPSNVISMSGGQVSSMGGRLSKSELQSRGGGSNLGYRATSKSGYRESDSDKVASLLEAFTGKS